MSVYSDSSLHVVVDKELYWFFLVFFY